MVETKSTFNSTPLTNVAEQPDNEEPLTPNHHFSPTAWNLDVLFQQMIRLEICFKTANVEQ